MSQNPAEQAYQKALAHLLDNYSSVFEQVFGRPLKDFWGDFGFDLVAFCDWVAPVEGVSLNDTVQERFGDKGFALLNNLLKDKHAALGLMVPQY